jgi:LDH2 family malate/lactate/ureidoglycolate dehydrogenase
VVLWFANPDKHSATGHVLMAIDIGKFRDLAEFKSDVDQLIDRLKATPTMEGFSEVLIPGEIETRKTAQHLRDGIPITEPVMKDLRDLARDLAVSVPTGWA